MRELLDTAGVHFDCAACASDAHEGPLPRFTWQMLERQLLDLASRPALARTVGPLVASLRRRASRQPDEQVLRELLCLAWVILEEE
jgi:hypothetical protein